MCHTVSPNGGCLPIWPPWNSFAALSMSSLERLNLCSSAKSEAYCFKAFSLRSDFSRDGSLLSRLQNWLCKSFKSLESSSGKYLLIDVARTALRMPWL